MATFSTTTSCAKLVAATTRAARAFDVVLELQLWWLGGNEPTLSDAEVESLLAELSELCAVLDARCELKLEERRVARK